jgi:hypothetical protein
MPYKFEVFWTQYQYNGMLAGLEIEDTLRVPTEKDAKRHIALLLNKEGVSNIGVKLCETWSAL